MQEGIITKGVGGLYEVKTDNKTYQCRARGLFRKKKITPLVGDRVKIDEIQDDNGYIIEIMNRSTELIRPPVANVNQAIIVFAIKKPMPNFWLLDRFLILAEKENLDVVICINKVDLDSSEEIEKINKIYEKAGYKIINTSCKKDLGINELRNVLQNKISVFSGPSGVGKSTLLNMIQPNLQLKTGDVSKKTSRGKHTTRHTELMELENGGWVLDTPGFSSLELSFIEEDELELYFNEIHDLSEHCKFRGCKHNKEPKCAVKEAVEKNEISKFRYENYLLFLNELKDNRRY
ncbi:ribosome small subunit-dependent GTPase A [Sporosalibacterium faouarense]|uniref:ribosome small subunit-dependent GTPase A n=1 Tax=Sporosalibacterium faouarense TaxID=516123 RepID=UPI00141D45DC|nr:ribosome small subunit-dependent GTPase A [Sporosalibacterium faouarense]MTI47719.1 ribosome small subunit-dependent GTPase A [Bacillota bacterium]